jgi:asparagine synthetase B (glutamine-hydrolysing)
MCGIYGIVNVKQEPLSKDAQAAWPEILEALGVYATERGMDSSGVATMNTEGHIKAFKKMGASWFMYGDEGYRSVVTADEKTFATIGHTRFATHGAKTLGNAHPFVFDTVDGGKIAGVHNGIVHNANVLHDKRNHAVDSANLFKGMSAVPLKKWPKVWRRAQGSMAIAVLKSTGVTLTLTRNHNPLAVSACPKLGIVVFASTEDILKHALDAAGVTGTHPKTVDAYTALTFRCGEKGAVERVWGRDTTTSLVPYQHGVETDYHAGWDGWESQYDPHTRVARGAKKDYETPTHHPTIRSRNHKTGAANYRPAAPDRILIGSIPHVRCSACLAYRPVEYSSIVSGSWVCDGCGKYYKIEKEEKK